MKWPFSFQEFPEFQGDMKSFQGNFRQKSQFLGKFPTKFFCRNRLYLCDVQKKPENREKKDGFSGEFRGFQDFQGRLFRKFSGFI
jgi:hypothetical protein